MSHALSTDAESFAEERSVRGPDSLLVVRGLTKRFGPVVANDALDFTVRGGEVHVLLGENGAGKSTLVKSLYGVHRPDAGAIEIEGQPVDLRSPAMARAHGIGMVFQDMRLIPALTVWENIALHLQDTPLLLKPRALRAQIAETSQRYGLAVHPDRRVATLSIGEWQRVELLKVLMGGVRILVLDEPTSVLTPQEVSSLFEVLDQLRGQGVGIILITHKLREVRAIADRVSVLRGGRSVLVDADPAQLSDEELITAMVGEPVERITRKTSSVTDEVVLSLDGVSVQSRTGGVGLRRVTLQVRRGEVLGVAGVAGSGQDVLTDVLAGVLAPDEGTVMVLGTLPVSTPVALRRAGVVQIVPDPVQQFVVPGLTIAEHVRLWNLDERTSDGGRSSLAERDAEARLSVAPAGRRLDQLSGGNIQRVVLTLATTSPAALVVASYPTRGLDILTTERTRELLRGRATGGDAVLLVSEDLDELLATSDRIAVMHEGEVVGVLDAGSATRQQLGALMTGSVAA